MAAPHFFPEVSARIGKRSLMQEACEALENEVLGETFQAFYVRESREYFLRLLRYTGGNLGRAGKIADLTELEIRYHVDELGLESALAAFRRRAGLRLAGSRPPSGAA